MSPRRFLRQLRSAAAAPPVFGIAPSISPASGAVGDTFTGTDGTASDTDYFTHRWLLDGQEIGVGPTVVPLATGSLALEVTAHGVAGSTVATSSAVAVAAVAAPVFSVAPSISPSSGLPGTTFTGSDGVSSNTLSRARRWLLNGAAIGTGTSVAPADPGDLTFEVTATGPGGSTVATSATATVTPGSPGEVPSVLPGGSDAVPTQSFTTVGGTYDTAQIARPEYGNMHGTAAAICQIVSPAVGDYPFFSDLEIMVEAYAANSGDGLRGGISYVDFWVAAAGGATGTLQRVTKPLLRNVQGYDRQVPAGLYSIKLPHASYADGGYDVYVRAVPSNPLIVPRTIGPLRVYRKATWDKIIDITPSAGSDTTGSVYRTYDAALAWWCGASGAPFPFTLMRFTEDATVTLADTTNAHSGKTNTASRRGMVMIDGNGFNVTVKRPSWGIFRPSVNRLRFKRMKFDVQYIQSIYSENGYSPMTFEQCELYSTDGTYELPGTNAAGMGPGTGKTARNQSFTRLECAFLNSYIHDCYTGDWSAMIKVGNLIERTCGDVGFTGSANLASGGGTQYARPALMFGNEIRDVDPEPLRTPLDAIQLAYSGAGTATWNVGGTGNNIGDPPPSGSTPRTLLLKVNTGSGAVTQVTITASSVVGTGVYTCQDAVNAINAGTGTHGFSATLIPGGNVRRFACIGPESGAYGSDQPIGTIVTTQLFPHVDLAQLSATTLSDNVIVSHNWGLDCEAQPMFASIQTAGYSNWNGAYVNNAYSPEWARVGITGLISQISGQHRHFLIAHNSTPFQAFAFRRDIAPGTVDDLCRIVNNVCSQGTTSGSGGSWSPHVARNYGYAGIGFSSSNLGSNLSGGTPSADYATTSGAQSREGMVPKAGAAVRLATAVPELPYDIAGNARAVLAPAGAFA